MTVGLPPASGPGDRADVVRVLRSAIDGAISLVDAHPTAIASLLRTGALDLVLARTCTQHLGVDSVTLRPTPAVLCVPDDHPLAGAERVQLAQLDGYRVLTWNAPGTPFTDLLLTRIAACGATVEPVRARVSGTSVLDDLASANAVALLPHDWPTPSGTHRVPLADNLLLPLPLLLLWPAGTHPLAVQQVQAETTTAA